MSSRKVIVVFKPETPESEINEAIKQVETTGGKITQRYQSALLGFAAVLPVNMVDVLNNHPSLDYIEDDGEVSIC
ncbi:hypothetical protein EDD21DRAFT_386090 [Dissophora ornata]|nr:hypothetical protein EDD21DRAFT_386090 [Dissophora ornata]